MTERIEIEAAPLADPMRALSQAIEIATTTLEQLGFTLEARGGDWAHWTRGFDNVVRAYAYRDRDRAGVGFSVQGDVSTETLEDVVGAVIARTGWHRRPSR